MLLACPDASEELRLERVEDRELLPLTPLKRFVVPRRAPRLETSLPEDAEDEPESLPPGVTELELADAAEVPPTRLDEPLDEGLPLEERLEDPESPPE